MEDHATPPPAAENVSARSATALRDLEERAKAALAASREQVSRLEVHITQQLEQIAATLHEQTEVEANDAAEADRTRAEVQQLNDELEKSRAAWLTERSALEAQRDQLSERVATLETQQHKAQGEWRDQLLDFEKRLHERQTSWNEQRLEWEETRTALERERDELRQKFELALGDVQRYRGRVAELEQELSRRPEASQADSAELVALRAERDALSERLERLERQPATQADANLDQQVEDLQRRFELAVEDVRELKTKNAQLESQLAAGGKRATGHDDGGSMDWESQKRRLLASLDGEGPDSRDEARQKEQATITGTIEMTDAVVAEKDREIAELKAQLTIGAGDKQLAHDEERSRKINELVDADEIIAEHRKRITQAERETQEKLRAAELELSVERAKLARHKAELEELRSDLESQRQSNDAQGFPTVAGTPRRRWLSKLGLTGEE